MCTGHQRRLRPNTHTNLTIFIPCKEGSGPNNPIRVTTKQILKPLTSSSGLQSSPLKKPSYLPKGYTCKKMPSQQHTIAHDQKRRDVF